MCVFFLHWIMFCSDEWEPCMDIMDRDKEWTEHRGQFKKSFVIPLMDELWYWRTIKNFQKSIKAPNAIQKRSK